ncbi:MAG: NADH-quinone oxidoreductase subunit A [Candidatus Latescibacterota bacterium]|nr:MAG: NADH-quinone oxidoreductase subunit A [Candidatus Latescibacterota bacterium]
MGFAPLIWLLPLAIAVPILLLGVQRLLAPKAQEADKGDPYECGAPPIGSAHQRLPIKFYLVAVLFLLFDIEVVFLFPWSVVFGRLGWIGLTQMLVFLGLLELALVYVWRKGALEWD